MEHLYALNNQAWLLSTQSHDTLPLSFGGR